MNLTKQQVSTKLQTAKTVDAIKLDSDENTQLLIRKLDDKVRQAKIQRRTRVQRDCLKSLVAFLVGLAVSASSAL